MRGCSWMEVAGGDVDLAEEGRVQGVSEFGTAIVVGVALRKKKWYFEVRDALYRTGRAREEGVSLSLGMGGHRLLVGAQGGLPLVGLMGCTPRRLDFDGCSRLASRVLSSVMTSAMASRGIQLRVPDTCPC